MRGPSSELILLRPSLLPAIGSSQTGCNPLPPFLARCSRKFCGEDLSRLDCRNSRRRDFAECKVCWNERILFG